VGHRPDWMLVLVMLGALVASVALYVIANEVLR
jgi:hypothetical protein